MRSPETVSRNMKAIRSTGSKIEILMGKEMWRLGLRYRKNDKTVYGKPDFTFKKYKVAVFVDSEFWHGYNWDVQKRKLNNNSEFWIKKIESNIARDLKVNNELGTAGWYVIRFWGKAILTDVVSCARKVAIEINKIKTRKYDEAKDNK